MADEVVYKITLEPEGVDTRVVYFIDKTGEPIVTDLDDAADAFDVVLSDNAGYELDGFEVVSIRDIPLHANPYRVG